jgi:hypothetical protein
MGLVTVLMVTMITITLRETRQTSRDRSRAVAVTSAEGAVDLALTQIQAAAVSSLPCNGSVTKTDSKPETMVITTTVSYLDATGAALSCPPPSTVVAAQALVKAVSLATPAGGGAQVKRTVESLVALKPKFSTDFDKAIFGNAGVNIGNNFDLYGQNGPDADVYTNGDFSCAQNEHLRGSVYSQGAVTMANTCTIDVNVWAKTGANISSGTISGDLLVSNGTANITGGTIAGKVKALTITPASWCTSHAGKCVSGASAAAAPPFEMFPQLKGDDATVQAWRDAGYVDGPTNLTNCSSLGSSQNPGKWLETQAKDVTQPTIIRTPCRVQFQTNAKNVNLGANVIVFADGGFDFSQTLTVASTDTTKHNLYLVHPYDFATRVGGSCATYNPGISLTQQVTVANTISELLYSPCDINKANNTTLYGQVYAGGTASIANKTDATYVPLPVFGAVATRYVLSYSADVLYKRENVG